MEATKINVLRNITYYIDWVPSWSRCTGMATRPVLYAKEKMLTAHPVNVRQINRKGWRGIITKGNKMNKLKGTLRFDNDASLTSEFYEAYEVDKEKQKLIDICFDIAMTMRFSHKHFKGMSNEKVAEWVANQLKECGFDTQPMGISWEILKVKQ